RPLCYGRPSLPRQNLRTSLSCSELGDRRLLPLAQRWHRTGEQRCPQLAPARQERLLAFQRNRTLRFANVLDEQCATGKIALALDEPAVARMLNGWKDRFVVVGSGTVEKP